MYALVGEEGKSKLASLAVGAVCWRRMHRARMAVISAAQAPGDIAAGAGSSVRASKKGHQPDKAPDPGDQAAGPIP